MSPLPEEPVFEIGVDIGGTFTDVVCRAPGRPLRILKLPSTRHDPSEAVLRSVAIMARDWAVPPQAIRRFVHGMTVATNAVLERKGARLGLITTEGFRDILEIGRQMRTKGSLYRVLLEPEVPSFLVRRARRRTVAERIDAEGRVVTPLDETGLIRTADELVSEGVEAIAICFLFSFLNSAHERRARALIAAAHPGLAVSVSHEVDPAFREYERTVATAFDAYVKPVIDRYLGRLEEGLAAAAVPAPLQIMQSRGGLAIAGVARERPVRLFLSGPAAGVIGGRLAGRAAGAEDLITVDIGGTSCDIALIAGGEPLIRAEGRIDRFPVRVPMVDVNTIGAGGGSIAWLDRAGGLRVGPHSAGADPGPACYGRGGTEATVTDASVLLGYIDPAYFAGGSLPLLPALATEAVGRIAGPLGLSPDAAALGIHRVLNAQMAEGIRLVSIRQGLDPRRFTLVALGGAGGIHATALARELGMERIVVPLFPGVLSAAGLLAAPVEHEMASAFPSPLAKVSLEQLQSALAALDRRCAELMAAERVAPEAVTIRYFTDLCYIGQSYTLDVPLRLDGSAPLERLYEDFIAAHDRVYGFALRNPARLVNVRTVHRAGAVETLGPVPQASTGRLAPKSRRPILLGGQAERIAAAVYDRAPLPGDALIDGPAIIEQSDTTILIEPGWRATVTAEGNLVLSEI